MCEWVSADAASRHSPAALQVGHDEPWSTEKISPLLGMYCARNYEHALELGASLVDFAGAGHTAALHVDAEKHPNKVTQFHSRINAGRMIVNSPSAMVRRSEARGDTPCPARPAARAASARLTAAAALVPPRLPPRAPLATGTTAA